MTTLINGDIWIWNKDFAEKVDSCGIQMGKLNSEQIIPYKKK